MQCPESIEELQELERMIPLCKTTLYDQAQARIESGAASSEREASRQLGEELERDPDVIRSAIKREKRERLGALLPPDNSQFRTSFTGDNEWYTPVQYIDAAREVMGEIDLDPATSEFGQGRIKAKKYYTVENDGLKQSWCGKVWMNPPYSQPEIKYFISKLISELGAKNTKEAIVLTHNYTDTEWFHGLISVADCICFTKGRIKYEKHDGTIACPTQGAAFFYTGCNEKKFREVFSRFGFVCETITAAT